MSHILFVCTKTNKKIQEKQANSHFKESKQKLSEIKMTCGCLKIRRRNMFVVAGCPKSLLKKYVCKNRNCRKKRRKLGNFLYKDKKRNLKKN